MLTTLLIIAAVGLPFALELYFDGANEAIEEEYIPDGR